jgi:cyclopropane fatty-acyl-phospholipid synthase-like methyltransferase
MEQTNDEHKIVTQSEKSHAKRFEAMLRLGDFNGKKILDVGCGLGAFYSFLKEHHISCDYHGIDINAKMIDMAKEKYKSESARFSVFDIIGNDMNETYDYIIVVGILNLPFGGNTNLELTDKLFAQVHKHAKIGYSIGMTSDLTRNPGKETYYYNASEVLKIVRKYVNNFKLDHSYLPHDFTISCYKDDFYSTFK